MSVLTLRTNKSEKLFFLSYIIFMFFSILMHSLYYRYFGGAYQYIVGGCIFLLIMQETQNRLMPLREIIGAIVLYTISSFLVIQGNGNVQMSFACVFAFAFGARNIDFRKICRITIQLTIAMVVFVILSSFVGIIENYHIIQVGNRSRYFLGFRYALNAPAFTLNVILLYVYYKIEKSRSLEIVGLLVFAFFLFLCTDSRLTFGLSVFALLIVFFRRGKKKNVISRNYKMTLVFIPVFLYCFVLSIWFAFEYSPSVPWMNTLNTILGNRLKNGRDSLMLYGVSLWGQNNIEWVGGGLDIYGRQSTGTYFYVDNLYIQLLQRYGAIFMIIFLVLATVLMIQCYKKKEYILVILLTIIALHGLIDDGIVYLQMNTFWLLFGSAVFGYIKSRKVDKASVIGGAAR